MKKYYLCRGILLLFAVFHTSCQYADGHSPASDQQNFAIHGGVDIIVDDPINCTPERVNKLNDAYYYLRNYVGSREFRGCLQDAFFAQTQRFSHPQLNTGPDKLWDLCNQHTITEIHCVTSCDGPFTAACAGPRPEVLDFVFSHIDFTDPELMAGIMLHEIMHDYGFYHSMGNGGGQNIEVWQAPTGIAAQCLYNVAIQNPNVMEGILLGRSELDGQIELNHTGGDDISAPYDVRCPDGAAVVSLGAYVEGDNLVTGLVLGCAMIDLYGESWAGIEDILIVEGNTSNSYYDVEICENDEVAVNINGRSGWFIDRVEVQCAPISFVIAGYNTTSKTLGPYGGLGGDDFARWCPDGRVLTGLRGRVDPTLPIGSIKPLCSPISSLQKRAMQVQAPMAGNPFGNSYDLRCSGTSGIVGLHGREGELATFLPLDCIHRIGIECKNLGATGDTVNNSQSIHISDGAGFGVSAISPNTLPFGDQQPSHSQDHDQCPPDFVLAGLYGRSGLLVDQIQGICVKLSAWRIWDGNPANWDWANDEKWLAPHGGSGGVPYIIMCPAQKIATGLWAYSWYGDLGVVYGLHLICEE